ncbi:MAG: TetR/AcrR family transcriptional regulator [Actinomycetota bacterium]
MTGLRERNKAKRVAAILDAAVELLGEHPLDDVTTEQIAAVADVSPATVYNLVGPRDELLRAIVARVVDDLVAEVARASAGDDDPVAVAELVVEWSVGAFTANSLAYRRIVAAGRSVGARRDGVIDPSQLQVAALRRARELGVLRGDVDPAGLGRQVYLSWIGSMEHWAEGRLDDRGFSVATRHGLFTVLAAAAVDPHRERFLAELRRLGVELESCWSAPPG